MPRPVSRAHDSIARGRGRDRHGRGLRSAVTGPHLPLLRSRLSFFDSCVSSALEYVRELWPAELAKVTVHIANAPTGPLTTTGVDRWQVDRQARAIVLYRIPIERLTQLHRDDDWHRRSLIESCVFRAVAELLGKDPWDIAPERYRHF
ncbi:metallopeptidase family protein [uncultured Schumannella sp.]|uniref:metallopeptidase family protein n=1 Tax=uncultured Schumannella sp. TaxID=1195956 RepID=UPI0025DA4698|nr:metallopeptidase family protein [uncultured Schumannella sp.]